MKDGGMIGDAVVPTPDAGDSGFGECGSSGRGMNFQELYSSDLREQLARLRQTVERDHDRRLQRIETDLRWIMTLVSAQLVAIVGGAIATFTVN